MIVESKVNLTGRVLTFRVFLKLLFSVLLVTIFVSYIIWQSRLLITGPVIRLDPGFPATTSKRMLIVSGVARNIKEIRLNGLKYRH